MDKNDSDYKIVLETLIENIVTMREATKFMMQHFKGFEKEKIEFLLLQINELTHNDCIKKAIKDYEDHRSIKED